MHIRTDGNHGGRVNQVAQLAVRAGQINLDHLVVPVAVLVGVRILAGLVAAGVDAVCNGLAVLFPFGLGERNRCGAVGAGHRQRLVNVDVAEIHALDFIVVAVEGELQLGLRIAVLGVHVLTIHGQRIAVDVGNKQVTLAGAGLELRRGIHGNRDVALFGLLVQHGLNLFLGHGVQSLAGDGAAAGVQRVGVVLNRVGRAASAGTKQQQNQNDDGDDTGADCYPLLVLVVVVCTVHCRELLSARYDVYKIPEQKTFHMLIIVPQQKYVNTF